ncbi:hypothetical protein Q7C36_001338 [Tachysurus vachellii]|uniref:Uncharacterized protein n=1 Tax=Tachysurus vachellii TaxID=175792 RepID=A0AA88NXL4_TACVA|nr:hypothetical protein Q7C36_001338 [Tachysurus vachellii]
MDSGASGNSVVTPLKNACSNQKEKVQWSEQPAILLLLAAPECLFHTSLNPQSWMQANPSDAIQLKPQTRSLLLLQATLGSISVGQDGGLIYRACQNIYLHLPATCNNQLHRSAHYTAAADRAAETLSIYGSRTGCWCSTLCS